MKNAMTVRTVTFRSQLDYLRRHGYPIIPLRTLVLYLLAQGPAPPPHAVVITADDGHESVFTEMLPIIREYQVPVTLFIYPSAISRIVVFKDNLLAQGRPDLAIHRRDGSLFRDREGLAWTNPYSRDVWNYNISIAVEAAKAGFDEIQFDYVRLPDQTGLVYERPVD
jgi:hypothetical protein